MIKMIILLVAIVCISIFMLVKGFELLGWLFANCGGFIAIALVVLSVIFWGFWTTVIIILGVIAWWYLKKY